jgi:hypothetical protein
MGSINQRISKIIDTCYSCVHFLLTNLKETDMANDWILDVLTDLKAFATENGLSALASQLDDTALVAAAEISSLEGKAQEVAGWEFGTTGRIHRTVAAR